MNCVAILLLLSADPSRMVSGYFSPSAGAFPTPPVLLALPSKDAPESQYPIMLTTDELEALYAKLRTPSLLYELGRRYQASGNEAEAEAYFRAYLQRAPYLDAFHDAAWEAVVGYMTQHQAEAEAVARAKLLAALPQPMSVLLGLVGLWP